jgi:hypothetical protein
MWQKMRTIFNNGEGRKVVQNAKPNRSNTRNIRFTQPADISPAGTGNSPNRSN